MTYKEYDNIFLEESGMPCAAVLLRNCSVDSYYGANGLEDRYSPSPRDASGITGTTALITTNFGANEGGSTASVVRNGDYIYTQSITTDSDGNRRFDVIEYNISTAETTIVPVETFVHRPSWIPGAHIAFIKDRKIAVFQNNGTWVYDLPYHYLYVQIYIVDFEAESSTLSLNIKTYDDHPNKTTLTADPYEIYSLEKNDGSIWLYIVGWWYEYEYSPNHMTSGIYVYYKNFTTDGAWVLSYIAPSFPATGSWDSFLYGPPVFVSKDYLVCITTITHANGNPLQGGIVGIVFNTNTNTISISNMWQSPDGYGGGLAYSVSPDWSNKKVYFNNRSFYDAGIGCDEFDPSTLTFTHKFTSDDYYYNWDLYVLSSRDKAYFYDYSAKKLYIASSATLVGTFDLGLDDEDWWDNRVCMRLDDSGPSIWWWDSTITSLKRISLDGTLLQTISTTVTEYTYSEIFLIHIGDSIVVLAGDTYAPPHIKYYLIS